MKAKLTLYREHFVIEVLRDKISEFDKDIRMMSFTPPATYIVNTLENLGVSQEALVALESLPRKYNLMVDFEWFDEGKDQHVLGYVGSVWSIKKVSDCKVLPTFAIKDHISIPNDTSPEAKAVIDELIDHPENFSVMDAGGVTGMIRKTDLAQVMLQAVPDDQSTIH
jgi:hypothetical protein